MMPSNVAARMTLTTDPDSLHGAVAAGLLGAGPVILGAAESCARLLERDGEPVAIVREIHAAGGRVPGFGHPVHKPVDPRAERILELADERGVSGLHVVRARELRDAVHEVYGKPLPMNVSMPIAAVLLDLGYSSADVNAVQSSFRPPSPRRSRACRDPGAPLRPALRADRRGDRAAGARDRAARLAPAGGVGATRSN
jgi:citrate synthase